MTPLIELRLEADRMNDSDPRSVAKVLRELIAYLEGEDSRKRGMLQRQELQRISLAK
jgi:hypothetical protein